MLTLDDLVQHFQVLGLQMGHTVLVHSAFSHIKDWIPGGVETLVKALLTVLGDTGTLMMPTHSTDNTDPSNWQYPPVPQDWWQTIREKTPAFNPETTVTRQMGILAEYFRRYPGVMRSNHPTLSFAAIGRYAQTLILDHSLTDGLGNQSPIGRNIALDGYVLLLGVGHGNNTTLHYCEHQADFPSKKIDKEGSAMFVNGQRQWVEYDMLDYADDDFVELGTAYENTINYQPGKIGQAEARYLRARPLVEFGIQWMQTNRN